MKPTRSALAGARLGSEAAWAMVGLATQLAGQLVVLKLTTTWLPRDEYGRLVLAVSVEAFVQVVGIASLLQGMSRLVPEFAGQGDLDRLIGATRALTNSLLMIVTGAAAVAATACALTRNTDLAIVTLATAALVYADYRSARTQYVALAARMRISLAAQRAVEAILRALAVLIVVRYFHTAWSALASWALASLLANAIVERPVRQFLARSPTASSPNSAPIRPRLLRFGVPLAIASVVTWTNTNIDRWLVEHFASLEEAGTYAAAAQLANAPFTILGTLLITFAWPIFYPAADRRDASARTGMWRLTVLYAVTAVAAWCLLWILRVPLTHTLLGPQHHAALALVPVVGAGWALFQLSQMFATSLFIVADTRRLVLPNLLAGLVALVGGAWLTHSFRAEGAAWALVAASGVRVVAMAASSRNAWAAWLRETPPGRLGPAPASTPQSHAASTDEPR